MSDLNELFPKDFETRVKSDSFLGNDLLLALNQEKPTSIRINPLKYKNNLSGTTKIPWSTNGFWLNERPQFTLDPHFHAGAYYPQEAGSQFLDSVLRQIDLPESPIVLDLCAAPGGKSTLIADFLNEKGLLLSNEIHSGRAKILKENLTKWGKLNTLVSNNSPSDFESIESFFDLIVVDAPCSGEGMFRKDLNARNEWSEANVEMCSLRQKEILSSCWDSLKPNGFLVYSTCTFNSTENEQIIEWMTEEFDCSVYPINLEKAQKGRDSIGYYALPHLIDTEGFYICVIQKNDLQKRTKKQKNNKSELS
ncbi:MAG: RsmB/NOP family class I SAM-dependent RNA methyltransferase, partial [Fluviicola sp.]